MKRDHSRLLPHPTYMHSPIRDEDGSPINLLFETWYRAITDKDRPSPRHALFHATYNGRVVLVKFSERYNSVAHRALVERGLAPLLYFSTQLWGGVHMSIMQFPDQASDAQHKFLGQELPEDVIKQVEDALAVLHEKNLVHGDIRRPNILVMLCI
ncbi:hypothetical protein JVT61DRAFT_7618 [Boletus reticuloceps]|uniref:Uncharacterized protein n=1 Tax=Boletus reticuloceps TaxID=495285 RepID=A0A8I2YIU9_9AGAM|nr:hypothetical protein JVT61DRAFT_7618 [Boletus reticuloceps]